MNIHSAFFGYISTFAEKRLLRMSADVPTPKVDALKNAMESTQAKEIVEQIKKDPNQMAALNTGARIDAANVGAQNLEKSLLNIAQEEFKHQLTKPDIGNDPVKALEAINAKFKAANVATLTFGLNADKSGIQVATTSPDKPASAWDKIKDNPETKSLLSGLPPELQTAVIKVLEQMNPTPELAREMSEFFPKIKGMPALKVGAAVYMALGANKDIPAQMQNDPRVKALAEEVKKYPEVMKMMQILKKEIDSVPSKDEAEAAKEHPEVLKKAQEMLKAAKDGLSQAKTDVDKTYIRESTLGKLQMLGVDVTNEEGLLGGTETPKMMKYKEKWEQPLDKFMGLMRLGGAILNKIKSIGDKGKKNAPAEGERKPEEVKESKKEEPTDRLRGEAKKEGKTLAKLAEDKKTEKGKLQTELKDVDGKNYADASAEKGRLEGEIKRLENSTDETDKAAVTSKKEQLKGVATKIEALQKSMDEKKAKITALDADVKEIESMKIRANETKNKVGDSLKEVRQLLMKNETTPKEGAEKITDLLKKEVTVDDDARLSWPIGEAGSIELKNLLTTQGLKPESDSTGINAQGVIINEASFLKTMKDLQGKLLAKK